METCKACDSGFHDQCNDRGPGEPCPCPCPTDDSERQLRNARRRVAYHDQMLRKAREAVAALVNGQPLPVADPEPQPDPRPLDYYRQPGDREMGRHRLALATKEANQK